MIVNRQIATRKNDNIGLAEFLAGGWPILENIEPGPLLVVKELSVEVCPEIYVGFVPQMMIRARNEGDLSLIRWASCCEFSESNTTCVLMETVVNFFLFKAVAQKQLGIAPVDLDLEVTLVLVAISLIILDCLTE